MTDDSVLKWKKRLSKKGPFYLLETITSVTTRWDHTSSPSRSYDVPMMIYRVIWNDGPKTKMGVFRDYMVTRYGVETQTVLNGETPFQLWNGADITENDFKAMLAVRQKTSNLPQFNLDNIIGVTP